MTKPIKILVVEDSEDDARLALQALRRGGFDAQHKRVDNADAMQAARARGGWDAVITDYRMPGFTGLDALRLFKATGQDIPFILVSGTIGEEIAVEVMKAGAGDYVMKNNLARLTPALERELQEAGARVGHRRAERDLQRFRLAMDVSADAIGLADVATMRFVYLNHAACRGLGYSREQLLQMGPQDVLAADRTQIRREYDAVIAAGDGGMSQEHRVIASDGRESWIELHRRALVTGDASQTNRSA